MSRVLAFDFGASAGRAIKAEYDGDVLQYREIHRFDNIPTTAAGHLCWDFPYLLREVKSAIDLCGDVHSLAFDTWGVDYGLLDKNDHLISLPVHYRDGRGEKAYDRILNEIAPDRLYALTGNQIMSINTLFQLSNEDANHAETLLFMPDLFAFALCGAKTTDCTIASTSQMLDLKNIQWQNEIAALTGKNCDILPEIICRPEIAGTYKGIKVIKSAGHDTQCAVAAAPFDKNTVSAFLSCGTWSLIGCEMDRPILTTKSRTDELSNELGADGRVNYLKNISGLWLIQEIRRNFRAEGKAYSFNDMEQLARAEEPFRCFIDPDAPEFASVGLIPEKIRRFAECTHQPVPQSDGALVRCIYESLALKYAYALKQISQNTGKNFEVLHILGGGTKDAFLCQMTADSLGIPVIAGPVEATALGNIILQLIALGDIKNIEEGRALIRAGEKLKYYEPDSSLSWKNAHEKFCAVMQFNK